MLHLTTITVVVPIDYRGAFAPLARCHVSLDGHTPLAFADGHRAATADLRHVRWISHCRDLVQLPVAA